MSDTTKGVYLVTWLGESDSYFEVELTTEQKTTIEDFLKKASTNVPNYDMPSINISRKNN